MHADAVDIAEEIARLRQRYVALLREVEGAVELPAQWTLSSGRLRWHVPVESVEEPDIDLEILSRGLILRACPPEHAFRRTADRASGRTATRSEAAGPSILHAVLPVPRGFDLSTLSVRCESGYVELCFARSRGTRV